MIPAFPGAYAAGYTLSPLRGWPIAQQRLAQSQRKRADEQQALAKAEHQRAEAERKLAAERQAEIERLRHEIELLKRRPPDV